MPFQKEFDDTYWCPGPWPWQWFDTCDRRIMKWCYNFSWVKSTGYGFVIYKEGCEGGRLSTWYEATFLEFGDLGTDVPGFGETCFEDKLDDEGPCDGSNTGLSAGPLTAEQQQQDWRRCRRCRSLFFDGYPDKGVCAADNLRLIPAGSVGDLPRAGRDLVIVAVVGGSKLHLRMFDEEGRQVVDQSEEQLEPGPALTELKNNVARHLESRQELVELKSRIHDQAVSLAGHVAQPLRRGHVALGWNYLLPHDMPPSPWAQGDWRYCTKCHVMFFDGYADKGTCPAGGKHHADGYHFVPTHDAGSDGQPHWRYCHKCHSMFYNGTSDKGTCPAGGSHAAQGYNFELPHL